MPKELYLTDSSYATTKYDLIVGGIDTNFYHAFNISFPLKYRLMNLAVLH